MNTAVRNLTGADDTDSCRPALQADLAAQKQAYLEQPCPGYEQRRSDLLALKRLLLENQQELIAAVNQDYGNRSEFETKFAEIFLVLESIADNLKHLKRWMKPQKRAIDVTIYPGARNRVIPQPLGVVGTIVPWNFPIQLAFSGLVSIFAAGNRAMVKMSENSRALTQLLIKITPNYFPAEKLKFYEETGEVGIQFSKLPFDHLLFTGSGATGRAVMASAAANLTPVTLELGGKSPAVIAADFPLQKAVERIMFGKMFNAGQICITTDYAWVHASQLEQFVQHCVEWCKKHVPDIHSNDYTSIIDQKSFERLQSALEDAREKGARLVDLSDGQVADVNLRKFPPHLVLNPTAEMAVLRREIFGPILPVKTYKEPAEVVAYINSQDRPLAFYPFTNDRQLQQHYITHVMSGGVCVNDVLLHQAQHDLPFGGVGSSGMGHYHGREGFLAFSKLRPVFYQARFSALKIFAPPYGKLARRALSFMLRLKS
ncbi:MAG: coniferyl aldehyde dehydrogenase [Xanthomonadales bacterium]|nr:coniferyl aldehyde dehydrogenase [Xanthomonadales bacterium]